MIEQEDLKRGLEAIITTIYLIKQLFTVMLPTVSAGAIIFYVVFFFDVLKLINCPWYFAGHFHSNFLFSAKWTFYHLRLKFSLYLLVQCSYNELEYKNYSLACFFFVQKKIPSLSPVWDTLCTLYEMVYATSSLSSSIRHIPPNFLIFSVSV